MTKFKNSKSQGDMGVGAAIAWFTSNGYTVCVPLTDSQAYDLVVDFGGLKRVQVKTTSHSRNGSYRVGLSVKGGNRSGTGKVKRLNRADIDFVYVKIVNGAAYFIPVSELGGCSEIKLVSKYDKFRVCEPSSEGS